MLLTALSLLLMALLFFKDYKSRSRMKLSERIPSPKVLPLLGMIFYVDSKLHMFGCLAVCHERHHGTLRHYDME